MKLKKILAVILIITLSLGMFTACGKKLYDVVLLDTVDNGTMINVIKIVRELKDTSLRETKDLCEDVPYIVLEAVVQEEAEALKTELEAVGAVAEIIESE